jgi:LysM repeat protein
MRRILTLGIVLALLLALATPAFAQGTIHVVQRGENLFRIALRYGVTVNALASANGLSNVGRIYVGQRLVIPTGGSANPTTPSSSGVHVVRRGENLFRIALRYGMTAQRLAAANGIVNTNRIYVGQRLVIPGAGSGPSTPAQPTPSGQTYTVRRGDTLSAIALRYGVSTWALARVNGIRNASLIYVGQVLRIPSGGNPAPPAHPSPPSPPAPTSGRWIDVNLSTQRLTAYQGSTAVRSTLVSTGLPRTPTPTGQYRVYVKYAATLMSGPGYYLPNVPYTMYFYRGYAIHGTYWHSNFGTPMSHGCVNLPTSEAQWLYNWSAVGTLIKIHY